MGIFMFIVYLVISALVAYAIYVLVSSFSKKGSVGDGSPDSASDNKKQE